MLFDLIKEIYRFMELRIYSRKSILCPPQK